MATAFENSHELRRGKVCVVCYKKATRAVSAGDIEVVRNHIIEGYSSSNADLPSGICIGCSLNLSKKRKDATFAIPNCVDDYDPRRKAGLRSSAAHDCDCRICKVALESGFEKHHKRKYQKKRGRPTTKSTPLSSFKVCGHCFAKLYRGCNHSSEVCNSRRNRVDLLVDLTSPTTLHRAALRTSRTHNGRVTPLGRPKEAENAKRELFTPADIYGIGQDLQLSGENIKHLVTDIRVSTGSRKSVGKGVMKMYSDRSHQLDDFFKLDKLTYLVKNKETKIDENVERHTIYCNNVSGLINSLLTKRDREWGDNMILRIGLDGGFLKFLLSLFDKDDPYPTINNAMSKRFKESGVKRALVIALVPEIGENYVNVKRLWLSLGLKELLQERKYTIATDLKLCNIILGMMTHSSCHPCCWCEAKKGELNKKGKARTIGSLMKLFWEYFESGCTKEDAKNYGNVIHQPMLNNEEEDDTPVILLIPPPELHLMTGPVNTMFGHLESVWPESEQWLKLCNVKKTDYQGGQFTGNDCRKLLNSVVKMPNPTGVVKNYADAFDSFNQVVNSCYSDQLKEDYVERIRIFSRAYNRLGINITPKIHAVVFHVAEFCAITGRGLAPWSEQTGESLHHDFLKTWEKFRVKSMDNPSYGDHLLRAVCTYNGQHV